MRIYERWYEEYSRHRYMQHMTNEYLIQRAKDILQNITSLTDQGQIGLLGPEKGGGRLMRLFSHFLMESLYRTGDRVGLFKQYGLQDTLVPNASFPDSPKGFIFEKAVSLPRKGKYLLKLGKVKYLKDMYENGRFRINPASSYSDPSLNYAIGDEELSIELFREPKRVHLDILDPTAVNIEDVLHPVQDMQINVESKTDYLVWCSSYEHDHRLVEDFSAECCVIIKDIGIFFKKLIDEVFRLFPGYSIRVGEVMYIDPLHPSEFAYDIFFAKHFRFMYQKEFRLVVIPPKKVEKLLPLDVEIGPMSEYGEFYEF